MKALVILIMTTLLTGCSSFFYYPDSKTYYTPEQFGISFDKIEMRASDGTNIQGMLLKSKSPAPKGLVIQFHGNAQNMSSHMVSLMWLTELGYDVFTFDYRGYGKSEGKPDPSGVNLDALAALQKGKELQEKRGSGKLIVYGQSLGGAVLMRALEDYGVDGIDHLILESTFMSYRSVAIKKLVNGIITIPLVPLAYLIVNNSYSPEAVPEIPVVVIHGENDPVVELEFGEEIFAKAKRPKEFWKIPRGGHIDTYFLEQGKYREQLIKYLK